MPAVVGTNSYVTAAEATTYFAARYGYGTWVAEVNKDAALISAAQVLDNYCQWYGYPVVESQALAFPRYPDADPVPQEIKDSQCEIAFLIVTQGSVNQKADDSVEELKAGSVSLKFKATQKGNPLINLLVDSMLLPYGMCAGSGSTKLIPIERC
jgi:hypothetical protein